MATNHEIGSSSLSRDANYGGVIVLIGFYPIVGDLLHTGHILALEEAK